GTKPHDGEVDALPRPLLDYLRGLPDRDRQVLFLRHGLGYSMQEVAEMMESPLSTTKYRLGVALQRVRKAIRRDTICGRKGADDAGRHRLGRPRSGLRRRRGLAGRLASPRRR